MDTIILSLNTMKALKDSAAQSIIGSYKNPALQTAEDAGISGLTGLFAGLIKKAAGIPAAVVTYCCEKINDFVNNTTLEGKKLFYYFYSDCVETMENGGYTYVKIEGNFNRMTAPDGEAFYMITGVPDACGYKTASGQWIYA